MNLLTRLFAQIKPLRCKNLRGYSLDSQNTTATASKTAPGLSEKVLSVTSGEVGPGASKTGKYKNPEYFCYNKMSYFEAEIEILKYRCPQPSNKMKTT